MLSASKTVQILLFIIDMSIIGLKYKITGHRLLCCSGERTARCFSRSVYVS